MKTRIYAAPAVKGLIVGLYSIFRKKRRLKYPRLSHTKPVRYIARLILGFLEAIVSFFSIFSWLVLHGWTCGEDHRLVDARCGGCRCGEGFCVCVVPLSPIYSKYQNIPSVFSVQALLYAVQALPHAAAWGNACTEKMRNRQMQLIAHNQMTNTSLFQWAIDCFLCFTQDACLSPKSRQYCWFSLNKVRALMNNVRIRNDFKWFAK